VLALFLAMVWMTGCASLSRSPKDYNAGYRERGVASWYGEPFHGRRTANGEVYDMYGLTAAHRVMPLGTRVKVTHLHNGNSVVVRVNDRGPFIRGRILDLSYEGARVLGMIESGTAPVEIEVIESRGGPAGAFTVQVGSFSLEENARALSGKLAPRYGPVFVDRAEYQDRSYFRVRVGAFQKEGEARSLAAKLSRREGLEAFVTRREP
jgi:rare lipoprotein A